MVQCLTSDSSIYDSLQRDSGHDVHGGGIEKIIVRRPEQWPMSIACARARMCKGWKAKINAVSGFRLFGHITKSLSYHFLALTITE